MWLLIAFILVPMIEIALFIQVGGAIGLWTTLLVVLVTAIAGSYLVREQGMRELANLRRAFSDLDDPAEPLAHGAMILFAGALLLTPGFFTDALGLALMIPAVRKAAFQWIRARLHTVQFSQPGQAPGQPHQQGDRVIDGEFQDVTQENKRPTGPSEWTRH